MWQPHVSIPIYSSHEALYYHRFCNNSRSWSSGMISDKRFDRFEYSGAEASCVYLKLDLIVSLFLYGCSPCDNLIFFFLAMPRPTIWVVHSWWYWKRSVYSWWQIILQGSRFCWLNVLWIASFRVSSRRFQALISNLIRHKENTKSILGRSNTCS